MTILPDIHFRAALTALLLLVTGCGPGTGGTGTGPSHTFASTVDTPSVTCSSNCGPAALRLLESRVELAAACLQFVHELPLPLDAAGEIVLLGTVHTVHAAGSASAPGSLLLQAPGRVGEAAAVTVTLRSATGAVLIGPVVLSRTEVVSAAPVCSPP